MKNITIFGIVPETGRRPGEAPPAEADEESIAVDVEVNNEKSSDKKAGGQTESDKKQTVRSVGTSQPKAKKPRPKPKLKPSAPKTKKRSSKPSREKSTETKAPSIPKPNVPVLPKEPMQAEVTPDASSSTGSKELLDLSAEQGQSKESLQRAEPTTLVKFSRRESSSKILKLFSEALGENIFDASQRWMKDKT